MENTIKCLKEWICSCGTYVIFGNDCPRCNKPKFIKK